MQFSDLEVLEDDYRLEINSANQMGVAISLLISALIFNAFLITLYSGIPANPPIPILVIFHSPLILMVKRALKLLFERYQIIIDGGILTIRFKNPFKEIEERFETNKINQIFVRQKKRMFSPKNANHQLVLEMYDGSRVDLNILSGIQNEMLKIKRLLDNHIGSNNTHVSK